MADELGTAAEVEQVDPEQETAQDTAAAEAGATAQQPTQPESFINPAELPEELKPHWRRMHGAYTKRLEGLNQRKADLELIDKFRSDPAFAQELLRYEAQRLGLSFAPVTGQPNGTPSPASQTAGTDEVPPRLVEAVKTRLAPELQWMAPSLAAAQWAAHLETTRPLMQRSQAQEQATRQREYEGWAEKLTESAPGWEQHEDEMTELLNFVKSPALHHKRFGSKLELLYRAVTGEATATQAAVERMRQAGRARVTTGQPGRTTTTNVTDRVRQATSHHDAMKVAAEEAERELRAQGLPVPD